VESRLIGAQLSTTLVSPLPPESAAEPEIDNVFVISLGFASVPVSVTTGGVTSQPTLLKVHVSSSGTGFESGAVGSGPLAGVKAPFFGVGAVNVAVVTGLPYQATMLAVNVDAWMAALKAASELASVPEVRLYKVHRL
jgi:hypothetical protein